MPGDVCPGLFCSGNNTKLERREEMKSSPINLSDISPVSDLYMNRVLKCAVSSSLRE